MLYILSHASFKLIHRADQCQLVNLSSVITALFHSLETPVEPTSCVEQLICSGITRKDVVETSRSVWPRCYVASKAPQQGICTWGHH